MARKHSGQTGDKQGQKMVWSKNGQTLSGPARWWKKNGNLQGSAKRLENIQAKLGTNKGRKGVGQQMAKHGKDQVMEKNSKTFFFKNGEKQGEIGNLQAS